MVFLRRHRWTLGVGLVWLVCAIGAPALAQQPDADQPEAAEAGDQRDGGDEDGADRADAEPADQADAEPADDGDGGAEPASGPDEEAADEPEDEFGGAIRAYQEAHSRYTREMNDYQATIDGIVESEYNQRVTKVNEHFDRKIRALEAVERDQRAEAIAAFEEYLRRYPSTPGYTPDALFRLAELHFEKANDDYLLADEQYQSQLSRYEAGELADPPEFPRRDYSETIALFEQLIDQWPDYEQADGAHYLLAYCNLQIGEEVRARDLFAKLIDDYPDSRFVAESWIRIGEYWFAVAEDRQELAKAKHAYEQAMGFPGSKFYDKALYKAAWTHFRMDEFDQAIREFKRLVRYSDEQREKTGQSGSVLRAESIQYIAVSLAEEDWDLDGLVDDDFGLPRVKTYLKGDEPYEREVLVQLVDYMFDNTRYDVATNMINYALDRYPRHRDNPKLHERLILALIRDGKRDASFAERRNLLAHYGPDSDWYQYQDRVGREEAVRYADNLVRDNLIQSATWFHEEAQKLRNEAIMRQDEQMLAVAQDQYTTAAASYADFLARYPNDKDIYQWNFYYAECLYYSEQYDDAYEQYRVVRELDIADNKYQEQAAFNAIKSLEFQMEQMARRGELPAKAVPGSGVQDAREAAREQEETDTDADDMAERGEQRRAIEAEPIPPMVISYVTAMDRYVVLGLKNDSDADLDIKFAFQAGKLFYDFKDYDTARERFAWIVDNHPENELAYLAGSLILETYRQEQDYQKLAMWAERLSEVIKGDQADAIKEEVRQFQLGAMFKSAEQLFAAKEYEDAAEEYLRLVNDAPDHQYAPKALNNAAVAYENIGKFESAMNLYERVYNDYPSDPLAGYALYRVAVNSERFFDFDNAVRTYRAFYDKYEGQNPPELEQMGFHIPERRRNALRSAAVLTENLQRYEDAGRMYGQYVRAYPGAEDAEGAQWRAIQSWKKAGDTDKMMGAIATYRREYGGAEQTSRVLEAMMMIADHYADQGNRRQATRWYNDIVDEYDKRQPDPQSGANFYAAKASFSLAEYDFQDWRNIEIKGSVKQQGRLLEKKTEGQRQLAKTFQEVWEYGSLEWTLASSFRIGSSYQSFAEALYNIPIPFEEGTEEWDIYRMKLDDMVLPLEDEAIDYYEQTIAKAREEKVVNEWTKKTLEALNQFMPQEYPLYKEERRQVTENTVTGNSFMSAEDYQRHVEGPEDTAFDEDYQAPDAQGDDS